MTEPGRNIDIAAAARGDRCAAGALLEEVMPRVRNLVRYLMRTDAEVDDVAQVALLAILRGLPSYRAEGTFSSWADRITVRETFAYLKRARRRDDPLDAGADIHAVPDPAAGADEYAMRRELVRGLDRLPDDQRRAIVLHHVVGLSMPEVARTMGIPHETARSRARLGMKKLRQQMHEEGHHDRS